MPESGSGPAQGGSSATGAMGSANWSPVEARLTRFDGGACTDRTSLAAFAAPFVLLDGVRATGVVREPSAPPSLGRRLLLLRARRFEALPGAAAGEVGRVIVTEGRRCVGVSGLGVLGTLSSPSSSVRSQVPPFSFESHRFG